MVKIDQSKVDEMFSYKINQSPHEFAEDCKLIQSVLKQKYDVSLSAAEAAMFWSWRSNQYDASWLTVGNNHDRDIIAWFDKYFNEFWNDNEGDE